MRDIKYWKEELAKMHPTEYIALLEAMQEDAKRKIKTLLVHTQY